MYAVRKSKLLSILRQIHCISSHREKGLVNQIGFQLYHCHIKSAHETRLLLGWPKSPFSFPCKIKEKNFHFQQYLYLFGYSEYDDYLPHGIMLVICSQLMSQFDRYQLQLVIVEHHPVRDLQHEASQTTFDTFSQSQHLPHTLHKSLCYSCVFTFVE